MTRSVIALAFLFAAVLSSLLCACGADEAALPRLAPDAVVLAFGDSITRGVGARPEQSYPSLLAENIGREVINAGAPGELSEKGLARLERELDKRHVDLLILCHGGNDILQRIDPAETEHNLLAMIALARERDVPVVMIAVPLPEFFLSAWEVHERVAEQTGVPFEDEILPDILGDNRYKSDYVHPNAAGYARLAAAIEALLRDHGAI